MNWFSSLMEHRVNSMGWNDYVSEYQFSLAELGFFAKE